MTARSVKTYCRELAKGSKAKKSEIAQVEAMRSRTVQRDGFDEALKGWKKQK